MSNYKENYIIIKNALEEAFLSEDLSTRLKGLQMVKKQIKEYLDKYYVYSEEIYNRYQKLAIPESNESETTRKYQAIVSYNNQTQNIQNLLKQGYLYVDALRESLTGESIVYKVGIIENGKLYEGNIDLLELIENSTLDIDSKIQVKNAAKLRMKKISINKLDNNLETSLEKNIKNSSSVFSAVYNYLTATIHKTPKINEGQAYETYQRILFQRQGKNRIPPQVELKDIIRVYQEVKSNNAAYYKGGDISNIQVKYLGGKPPSLTTLASIKRVLTNSLQTLEKISTVSKPKGDLSKGLVNLFTQKSSKIYNDIQFVANEKAKKQIKNKLLSIQGIALIQN